ARGDRDAAARRGRPARDRDRAAGPGRTPRGRAGCRGARRPPQRTTPGAREGLMIAVAVAMQSAPVWVLAPPPAHSPDPEPLRSRRRAVTGWLGMEHTVM